MEILLNSPKFILVCVFYAGRDEGMLIIFVYRSLNKTKRKFLWDSLKLVILGISILQMAIRDFNAILFETEKSGGRSRGQCYHLFGHFMDCYGLYDLGFKGLNFTWQKGMVFERLDRAIGNGGWVNSFPNCTISHLSRIKSDHQPILLSIKSEVSIPKECLFRFLIGWIDHQGFSDFVK